MTLSVLSPSATDTGESDAARNLADVVRAAREADDLARLDAASSDCRACPRLVAWREEVAATKRAAFRDQEYWARPVPGFGPADARIAILGLAEVRIPVAERGGELDRASQANVGQAGISRESRTVSPGYRV